MKNLAWVAGLLIVVIGSAFAHHTRSTLTDGAMELAFFFSDSTRDLEAASRALGALRGKHPSLRMRPVFLVDDFASLGKPPGYFARGIRELQYAVGQDFGVRVYDEEGLALARELKLDRLPAWALIVNKSERRRAVVAYGTQANLEELVRCGK